MSEQFIAPLGLQTENEALMQESELGLTLVDAYRAAIEEDPNLAEALIVALDGDSKKVAFARQKWLSLNTTGKHEVHIRLEDTEGTIALYEKSMRERPSMVAVVAEKMNQDVSEITPFHLHLFSFLHELGHVSLYIKNEDNPERYNKQVQAERDAQPLGPYMYRDILDPNHIIHRSILQEPAYYLKAFGTSSIPELANMQAIAYRKMTIEAYADNFVATVVARHPELLTQAEVSS